MARFNIFQVSFRFLVEYLISVANVLNRLDFGCQLSASCHQKLK